MTVIDPTCPLVQLVNIHKEYVIGRRTVHALRGITVDIALGSFIVLRGPSG